MMSTLITNEITIEGRPLLHLYQESTPMKGQPVIIGMHGFTQGKESSMEPAIAFAREGFHVIMPDADRHSERQPAGYQFKLFPDLLEMIINSREEFPAIRDWARDNLEPASLSLYGFSMGGMALSQIIGKYPEDIDAAAQFSSTFDILGLLDRVNEQLDSDDFDLATLVDPDMDQAQITSLVEDLRQYDVTQDLSKLADKSLFIFNGEADSLIAPDHNQQLVDRLQEEYPQAKVQLVVMPNYPHFLHYDIAAQAVKFVKENLS